MDQAFSKKPEKRDAQKLADGGGGDRRLALFARTLAGQFLAGPLSAADFALYPMVAFLFRCRKKLPDLDPPALMTPALAAWKARVEALPYFESTIPPHWQKTGLTMKLTTTAFPDHGAIPGEFAFAVIDPATHVRLSANRNPDFAWSDLPPARFRSRSSATIPTCLRAATTSTRKGAWFRPRCRASTSSTGR